MTLSLVVQAILAGITNGFVYALFGMGLAAIFKGSRVINAMQGEFGVIGAMVVVLLTTQAGWPYALAIAAGVLSGVVIGAAIELSFVHHTRQRDGIHRLLETEPGLAVRDCGAGPALAVTAGATQVQRSGAVRPAIEIERVRQEAGVHLNLAERHLVGERPVGHGLVGFIASQV